VGLRRLVRDGCHVLARLPLMGRVGSLNAAVAGSIALYLAWAARRAKGRRIDAPPES
jgi:23S rRNA (guanosine2251-2'-O)-methyltransferase